MNIKCHQAAGSTEKSVRKKYQAAKNEHVRSGVWWGLFVQALVSCHDGIPEFHIAERPSRGGHIKHQAPQKSMHCAQDPSPSILRTSSLKLFMQPLVWNQQECGKCQVVITKA